MMGEVAEAGWKRCSPDRRHGVQRPPYASCPHPVGAAHSAAPRPNTGGALPCCGCGRCAARSRVRSALAGAGSGSPSRFPPAAQVPPKDLTLPAAHSSTDGPPQLSIGSYMVSGRCVPSTRSGCGFSGRREPVLPRGAARCQELALDDQDHATHHGGSENSRCRYRACAADYEAGRNGAELPAGEREYPITAGIREGCSLDRRG